MSNKRQAIAKAFIDAKPHLWGGMREINEEEEEEEIYICFAIYLAKHLGLAGPDSCDWATEVIHKRREGYTSLACWLDAHGVPYKHQNTERLQAHRHAWLDQLIAEFSS